MCGGDALAGGRIPALHASWKGPGARRWLRCSQRRDEAGQTRMPRIHGVHATRRRRGHQVKGMGTVTSWQFPVNLRSCPSRKSRGLGSSRSCGCSCVTSGCVGQAACSQDAFWLQRHPRLAQAGEQPQTGWFVPRTQALCGQPEVLLEMPPLPRHQEQGSGRG